MVNGLERRGPSWSESMEGRRSLRAAGIDAPRWMKWGLLESNPEPDAPVTSERVGRGGSRYRST